VTDNQLYSAIAGAENCAYRLLDNSIELIRNQGDTDKIREILDKQLLIMNTAMATMLAYRETLSMPPAASHE
jgi:hypothetical protein